MTITVLLHAYCFLPCCFLCMYAKMTSSILYWKHRIALSSSSAWCGVMWAVANIGCFICGLYLFIKGVLLYLPPLQFHFRIVKLINLNKKKNLNWLFISDKEVCCRRFISDYNFPSFWNDFHYYLSQEVIFSDLFVCLSVCELDYGKTSGPIFIHLGWNV